MKKIILIALSLMLTLGILATFAVAASADEATGETALPAIPEDIGRFAATLEELGLDYDSIWNAFPEELEQSYENGVLTVNDEGFTDVTFWSYLNYEIYQLTLADGKWQGELPADVGERGGIVYVYVGAWKSVTRGGTKESVLLDGEDRFERPFMIEVMWDFLRVFSARQIHDKGYSVDAYYTPDGELDYLSVSGHVEDYQTITYYNAQREAIEVSAYYNGWIYMSPDGNWYSNSDFDSEVLDAPPPIAGMSFAEVAALNPCFLDCGDHKPSESSCENDQLCTVCFDVIGKAIGHDWADATCTAPQICGNCGETYGDSLGHSYDAVVTAPDCESGGYTTYTCSACGHSYVGDETAALGHTEVVDDAVAPTCTEPGLAEGVHCSACDEVLLAQSTVDAPDHVYDDDKDATCNICGEAREIETETDAETETDTEPEMNTDVGSEVPTEKETTKETEETTEKATEKAPAVEETEGADSTTVEENGGCGATVGGSAVAVMIMGAVGFVLARKKKED